MNAREALAEARKAYAAQAARQSQIDNIAAEFSAGLAWIQEHPALSGICCQPPTAKKENDRWPIPTNHNS